MVAASSNIPKRQIRPVRVFIIGWPWRIRHRCFVLVPLPGSPRGVPVFLGGPPPPRTQPHPQSSPWPIIFSLPLSPRWIIPSTRSPWLSAASHGPAICLRVGRDPLQRFSRRSRGSQRPMFFTHPSETDDIEICCGLEPPRRGQLCLGERRIKHDRYSGLHLPMESRLGSLFIIIGLRITYKLVSWPRSS